MPASIQPEGKDSSDQAQEATTEALVYGLRARKAVHLLVERLLQYSCLPRAIWRIDEWGSFLGVSDLLTDRTFYVTVRRWGPGTPTIEWTVYPRLESTRTKRRADMALRDFMAPGNPPPWWVKYEIPPHLRRAKTPSGAS